MSGINFKALHAIQLVSVETRELFIRLNGPVEDDIETIYKEHIQIGSAHSVFNSEDSIIHVGLRLSLGMDKDTALPLSMRVEITGTFSVNTDEFSVDNLDDWANKNAPYILYPFIREHSFALATRCGLPPMILPLVQVPTITSHEKC